MFTEESFTIPALSGISETTITEHKKLYAGYVKNANVILEKITTTKNDLSRTYELGELYRRFSFEFNGMRNHECYFTLLTGSVAHDSTTALGFAIIAQWSTVENFIDAYVSLAMTRGIGWAMLSYDTTVKKLFLHWVDEQHLGQLQGTHTIIALDMWEHSYVADYNPSGKARYIADFFKNMHWPTAEKRFVAATALPAAQ